MTAREWTSLAEHALWPLVAAMVVIVFRTPLSGFLSSLAGRVNKVSVMSVSIELAVAQPADPPWRAYSGEDVRGLVAAHYVSDTAFSSLRDALNAPGTADYFVVDLRSDGDEWLTTRLYLFAYLLGGLKAVRAIVFVATRGDVARSFLGVASVEDVMRALEQASPPLLVARLEVEDQVVGRVGTPLPVDPQRSVVAPAVPRMDTWWDNVRINPHAHDVLGLAHRFLDRVQWQQQPGTAEPDSGWLKLPQQAGVLPTWERAAWIRSSDLTDGVLRDAIEPEASVVDNPSWTAEERAVAVASTRGDFVALLSPSRRFDRLVDSRGLLAQLAESYAAIHHLRSTAG